MVSFNAFIEDAEYIRDTVSLIKLKWTDTYNSTTDYPDFDTEALATETPTIVSLLDSAYDTGVLLYEMVYAQFPSYPPEETYINAMTDYMDSLISDLNSVNVIFESLLIATNITSAIYDVISMLTSYFRYNHIYRQPDDG
jgi:hypothetical protein